jgi:spore coat protein U-like protein
MKTSKLLAAVLQPALGASLLLLLPGLLLPSRVASAATATASIGVTILGRADEAVAAGAVSVASLRPIVLGGSAQVTATLRLEGARNAAFSVTVPDVARATGDGLEIVVRPSAPGVGSTGRLSPEGSREIEIGARVDPGRAPAPGRYSGTFPVTVAYN